MNKYQRVLNKFVKYDFEMYKALGGTNVSFRCLRTAEKILIKKFNRTFEEELYFKNIALKALNDIDNFKKTMNIKGDR